MPLVQYDSGSESDGDGHVSSAPAPTQHVTGIKRKLPLSKEPKRLVVDLPDAASVPAARPEPARVSRPSGLAAMLPAPKHELPAAPILRDQEVDLKPELEPQGPQEPQEQEPQEQERRPSAPAFVPYSLAKKRQGLHLQHRNEPRDAPSSAKRKLSLFQIEAAPAEDKEDEGEEGKTTGAAAEYEPIMVDKAAFGAREASEQATTESAAEDDSLPEHLLSRRERRQGGPGGPIKFVEVNAAKEYEKNEELRASGAQIYQPVRTVGAGRHQISGLLNMAISQKEQYEQFHAEGRQKKRESRARYGF